MFYNKITKKENNEYGQEDNWSAYSNDVTVADGRASNGLAGNHGTSSGGETGRGNKPN